MLIRARTLIEEVNKNKSDLELVLDAIAGKRPS